MKRFILFLPLLALAAAPVPAQDAPAGPLRPSHDVPIHGAGKRVETPDGALYYETEGSGPPVYLVAGGPGGGHASFHPWFSRLADGFTVVYLDNIGRGRSDRLKDPKGYTVARDAEDIEALRKALGHDKIHIIGHSYGGYPALAYALNHPDHVARLVLSSTLYNADAFQANIDSANWNARHQYPEVWEKLMELRRRGVKSSADAYGDLYGETMGDLYWFDMANEDRMFRGGDPADGFNGDVYLAFLGEDPEWKVGGTMKGYDPSAAMRRMATPTLVIAGRYDRISTPRVALDMHRLIPGSRLDIFEKSGHRPWIEETDRYFQTVRAFLKGE